MWYLMWEERARLQRLSKASLVDGSSRDPLPRGVPDQVPASLIDGSCSGAFDREFSSASDAPIPSRSNEGGDHPHVGKSRLHLQDLRNCPWQFLGCLE